MQTAVLLGLTAVVAQGPPPPQVPRVPPRGMTRDVVPRPDPTGTGVIRGRVVTADTGSPIRRATVSLQPFGPPPAVASAPPAGPGGAPGAPLAPRAAVAITSPSAQMASGRQRTMTTDLQGMFEFTGLPAGSYRMFATPGQYSAGYLGIAYGGTRPMGNGSMDTGTPIELADGQRFDKATIALPRGAAITGRVTDENGEPMARVQVYTMFFAPGSARPLRSGANAQTDDLGHFRLFGLTTGEYAVAAEARGPTFVQPNAPAESEDDSIGFMTTYYPGTADEAAAQRVRTRTGAETQGLEIRMAMGRLFRISGIVTDSQGRAGVRTGGQLYKGTSSNMTTYGFSTDEEGRFRMRNIPPGNYRLIIRGRSGPNGDAPQGEPVEMANMPIAINSDLEGLVVLTAPGVTITGQVVFDPAPPQVPPGQQPFQVRINAASGDPEGPMGMSMPQVLVAPDLTFTMKGLFGEVLLRTGGPNMYLKSVSAGGQDITDTPHQFRNGEQVTVLLTTRGSTLEGTVSDAAGKPALDATIFVFSEDKASWRPNAVRTRRAGVDPTGKYRLPGLLPGRYYIIAAPRDRWSGSPLSQDAAFFEQLAKEATLFVIGEDEQRQVDLKVAVGAGG